DLATANSTSATVSVRLGNGDGTFAEQVAYGTGSLPFSVATADLDGDGRLDLAVCDFAGDDVNVLLGQGDGTFADAFLYAAGDSPVAVLAHDLDHDGDVDLAVVNLSTGDVSVLLNVCVTADCFHVLDAHTTCSPDGTGFTYQVHGTTCTGTDLTLE